jgi:phosphoserine phosphatase
LAEIVMTSHSGMPVDTFDQIVREWIDTARHPVTRLRYVDMVYAPMLELLHFLRANGYKTFIVSGGGIDFLRAWAEEAYGIPPYQVVGSSAKTTYTVREGLPELIKAPALDFIDDKEGKVIGIHRHIGKQPVFAAGNSDGDVAMLQYTIAGNGYPRFGLIVHHTDSLREFAYDRDSHIGKLAVGLDSAAAYGWLIVDMARDWTTVYPIR